MNTVSTENTDGKQTVQNSKKPSPLPDVNRRSVLRGIGGVASSGIVATTAARANPGKAQRKFVGISYDSLTHRRQDVATARVKRDDDRLNGTLSFGGFEIPLDQEQPNQITESFSTYLLELDDPEYVEDDLPLSVRIDDHGNQLVGYATRPTGGYANLGFSIGLVDEGFSAEGITRGLRNGGEGVVPRGLDSVPDVPRRGVPTNTSIKETTESADRAFSHQEYEEDGASSSDVSTSSHCGDTWRESGQTGEDSNPESETWDSDNCWSAGEDISTSWSIVHGLHGRGSNSTNYKELSQRKYCWTGSYFDQVPEDLLDDSCDKSKYCYGTRCWEPYPMQVRHFLRHPTYSEYNIDDYEIEPEEPSPDSQSDNQDFMDTLLAVPWGIASRLKYVQVGLIVLDYIMGDGSTDSVSLSNDTLSDGRQNVNWTVQMPRGNSDYFPDSQCSSTAARFDLVNRSLTEDDEFGIANYSRYTFNIASHGEGCPCSTTAYTRYNITTDWVGHVGNFVKV